MQQNSESTIPSSRSNGDTNFQTKPQKALFLSFWLNLFFSIIELIGGVLSNSSAIVADAFHDFMDALAIGIALIFEKISKRKRTQQFSYGYKRFSLLSALGFSLFLLIGSVTMIHSAYTSFVTPRELHTTGMLGLALLGLAVNGFAFYQLKISGNSQHSNHNHNHSHGHNHGHSHTSESIMLHFVEDILGWAAVLIGAIMIYFTGWTWIDGVLTIAIALFIGFNATKNLIRVLRILLQSVPENLDMDHLRQSLLQLPQVSDIHDLHVWSMDGKYHVATVHVVVNTNSETMETKVREEILNVLNRYDIQHSTVQIETTNDACQLKEC